jgi:polysaccharide export outer membrane protein
MFSRISLSFMALLALLTSGCASGVGSLPELAAPAVQEYRLAPGDEIRVLVPGLSGMDATSTTTYVVNDRGQVSIPSMGPIEGSGKTIPELEQAIAQRLVESQLLVSPTVSVQPIRLRPFYILGEVNRPGEYPYRPGLSVLSAISVAGGYTFRADQRQVAITRIVNGQPVTARASDDAFIQPGDTIRVHEKWF